MGVEKVTFGEEEYRMSPFLRLEAQLAVPEPRSMTRTRLCPTTLPSGRHSTHARILNTECRSLVSPSSSPCLTILGAWYETDTFSHLPTHQFLSRNVRLSNFQPGKVEQSYRTWKNGGTPSVRIYGMSPSAISMAEIWIKSLTHCTEVLYAMRYTLVALILALIYHAVVRFGGGKLLPTKVSVLGADRNRAVQRATILARPAFMAIKGDCWSVRVIVEARLVTCHIQGMHIAINSNYMYNGRNGSYGIFSLRS